MQQPVLQVSRSTPIGFLLGLLLATPVFVLILADLSASRPKIPIMDLSGAKPTTSATAASSEDELSRECDLFADVLEDALETDSAAGLNEHDATAHSVGVEASPSASNTRQHKLMAASVPTSSAATDNR